MTINRYEWTATQLELQLSLIYLPETLLEYMRQQLMI